MQSFWGGGGAVVSLWLAEDERQEGQPTVLFGSGSGSLEDDDKGVKLSWGKKRAGSDRLGWF